jgi:hypothetical protein
VHERWCATVTCIDNRVDGVGEADASGGGIAIGKGGVVELADAILAGNTVNAQSGIL